MEVDDDKDARKKKSKKSKKSKKGKGEKDDGEDPEADEADEKGKKKKTKKGEEATNTIVSYSKIVLFFIVLTQGYEQRKARGKKLSPADDVTQRLMSPLEVREHLKLLWNNEKEIIELIYSSLVKGTGTLTTKKSTKFVLIFIYRQMALRFASPRTIYSSWKLSQCLPLVSDLLPSTTVN